MRKTKQTLVPVSKKLGGDGGALEFGSMSTSAVAASYCKALVWLVLILRLVLRLGCVERRTYTLWLCIFRHHVALHISRPTLLPVLVQLLLPASCDASVYRVFLASTRQNYVDNVVNRGVYHDVLSTIHGLDTTLALPPKVEGQIRWVVCH